MRFFHLCPARFGHPGGQFDNVRRERQQGFADLLVHFETDRNQPVKGIEVIFDIVHDFFEFLDTAEFVDNPVQGL